MPIRRTSVKSSKASGFYLPELFHVIGSRSVDQPQSDYWGDMSSQMFSWESLAYIEWWGN